MLNGTKMVFLWKGKNIFCTGPWDDKTAIEAEEEFSAYLSQSSKKIFFCYGESYLSLNPSVICFNFQRYKFFVANKKYCI